MKRILLALSLVVSMFSIGGQAEAAPEPASVPPIAWSFSLPQATCQPAGCTPNPGRVHVEKYYGKMRLGTTNTYPNQVVEVCDPATCQTVSVEFRGTTDSNIGDYVLETSVPVPTAFNGRILTFAFPNDLNNHSAGFGPKSNAVDTSKDRRDGIGAVTGKPLMQIKYGNLFSNEINNIGVCFNNDGSGLYVPHDGVMVSDHIDLSGYVEARYALYSGTRVVESGPLAGANSNSAMNQRGGMCEGDSPGGGTVFAYQRISGLSPGTVYSLNYTLSGPGKRDISADLKFLTPGGCPSSDVGELTGATPWGFLRIDSNGKIIYPFTTAIPASWVKGLIGTHVAPMYATATKRFPLLHRNSADWPNMWRYIPELDDWAQSVNGEFVITTETIISATMYAQCPPSDLKVTVTALTEQEVGAKQFCEIENGEVIPTGQGPCLLKVVVSRVIASKNGVQKMSVPTTLKVPFFIDSFTKRPVSSAKPTAPTALGDRVRACTFAATKKYSPSIIKKVVPCSRLKAKKGQTLAVVVDATSKAICHVKAGVLKRKAKGSCVLNVSVKKGKKTLSSQKVMVSVK